VAVNVPDIKALFVEALNQTSGADLAAFLDRACAGLPEVRARGEDLLAAIGKAGSFLETPALVSVAGREPGEVEGSLTLGDGTDSGASPVGIEARQVSLDRPVAVKMIRAGRFGGEANLRRSRVEVEAIAQLDHPRIVPIHGVWDVQDCHYFSMKPIRIEVNPEFTEVQFSEGGPKAWFAVVRRKG
jgi:hypothetical protein